MLRLGFFEHAVDFGIAPLEQVSLSGYGLLEFAGASGPLLTWPGSQISERTNGTLARSLRRSHRLDQLVVDVGLTLMSARCPAEKHWHYRQRFALPVKKILILYSPLQWLILLFSLALSEQNQSLVCRLACNQPGKLSLRAEVGLVCVLRGAIGGLQFLHIVLRELRLIERDGQLVDDGKVVLQERDGLRVLVDLTKQVSSEAIKVLEEVLAELKRRG